MRPAAVHGPFSGRTWLVTRVPLPPSRVNVLAGLRSFEARMAAPERDGPGAQGSRRPRRRLRPAPPPSVSSLRRMRGTQSEADLRCDAERPSRPDSPASAYSEDQARCSTIASIDRILSSMHSLQEELGAELAAAEPAESVHETIPEEPDTPPPPPPRRVAGETPMSLDEMFSEIETLYDNLRSQTSGGREGGRANERVASVKKTGEVGSGVTVPVLLNGGGGTRASGVSQVRGDPLRKGASFNVPRGQRSLSPMTDVSRTSSFHAVPRRQHDVHRPRPMYANFLDSHPRGLQSSVPTFRPAADLPADEEVQYDVPRSQPVPVATTAPVPDEVVYDTPRTVLIGRERSPIPVPVDPPMPPSRQPDGPPQPDLDQSSLPENDSQNMAGFKAPLPPKPTTLQLPDTAGLTPTRPICSVLPKPVSPVTPEPVDQTFPIEPFPESPDALPPPIFDPDIPLSPKVALLVSTKNVDDFLESNNDLFQKTEITSHESPLSLPLQPNQKALDPAMTTQLSEVQTLRTSNYTTPESGSTVSLEVPQSIPPPTEPSDPPPLTHDSTTLIGKHLPPSPNSATSLSPLVEQIATTHLLTKSIRPPPEPSVRPQPIISRITNPTIKSSPESTDSAPLPSEQDTDIFPTKPHVPLPPKPTASKFKKPTSAELSKPVSSPTQPPIPLPPKPESKTFYASPGPLPPKSSTAHPQPPTIPTHSKPAATPPSPKPAVPQRRESVRKPQQQEQPAPNRPPKSLSAVGSKVTNMQNFELPRQQPEDLAPERPPKPLPKAPSSGFSQAAGSSAVTEVLRTGSPGTAVPMSDSLEIRLPRDSPGTGVPTAGSPGTGVPTAGSPGTGLPRDGFPGSGLPRAGSPGTGLPRADSPGIGLPRAETPDSTASPRPSAARLRTVQLLLADQFQLPEPPSHDPAAGPRGRRTPRQRRARPVEQAQEGPAGVVDEKAGPPDSTPKPHGVRTTETLPTNRPIESITQPTGIENETLSNEQTTTDIVPPAVPAHRPTAIEHARQILQVSVTEETVSDTPTEQQLPTGGDENAVRYITSASSERAPALPEKPFVRGVPAKTGGGIGGERTAVTVSARVQQLQLQLAIPPAAASAQRGAVLRSPGGTTRDVKEEKRKEQCLIG